MRAVGASRPPSYWQDNSSWHYLETLDRHDEGFELEPAVNKTG